MNRMSRRQNRRAFRPGAQNPTCHNQDVAVRKASRRFLRAIAEGRRSFWRLQAAFLDVAAALQEIAPDAEHCDPCGFTGIFTVIDANATEAELRCPACGTAKHIERVDA